MFDIINDILYEKDGESLNRVDFDDEFKLYLIQRWISMSSNSNIEFLNRTVNILYNTLDSPQQFKLMSTFIRMDIPKKIRYIKGTSNKKSKNKKKEEEESDISGNVEESILKIENSLKYIYGEEE